MLRGFLLCKSTYSEKVNIPPIQSRPDNVKLDSLVHLQPCNLLMMPRPRIWHPVGEVDGVLHANPEPFSTIIGILQVVFRIQALEVPV